MKNTQDYQALSAQELEQRLAEAQTRLQRMRFQHAVTPMQNTNEISQARREVARLKTFITQRQKA